MRSDRPIQSSPTSASPRTQVAGALSRNSSDDAQAHCALARGDHGAVLSILIKAYGPQIHRYCCRKLPSRAMADDVHQLVFVQAFEDIGSFKGGSAFGPWLSTIARNRCIDALKSHRRWSSRFDVPEDLPDGRDPRPTSEAELAARSTHYALDLCLAELPPHVQTAVLLRYEDDLSFEEIARVNNELPGTLQARVARALPVLRQSLLKRGIAGV